MMRIGVLQGRLSPAPGGRPQVFPQRTWRDEFAAARRLRFDAIEWLITEEHIDTNPIWNSAGVEEIRCLCEQAAIAVSSVCADCFIREPLVRAPAGDQVRRLHRLNQIIVQAGRIGAPLVLVPLLEESSLSGMADGRNLIRLLEEPLSLAAAHQVVLALETDWPAEPLQDLLGGVDLPALRVYYDIGNAVAAGFDPSCELETLGPLVRGVHLKDCRRGGVSVPLGEGDADFDAIFAALDAIGYDGSLILETPAGDDPIAAAAANLAFARARSMMRVGRNR